jgi:hypothetical protein
VQKTEYKVEVLFEDVDLDFANKKEIELIKLYGKISDGNGPLANISDGGDGVHGLFGEKNPSFGKKGPLSPLYGRTLTDEQKEKLRRSKLGKKRSPETIEKMRKAFTGKKWTEEQKKTLKDAKLKHGYYSKKVICTKTGKVWNSVVELAKELNVNYFTFVSKLNGKSNNNTSYIYFKKSID